MFTARAVAGAWAASPICSLATCSRLAPQAAELDRHEGAQVAGLGQLGEVLGEELVGAVVAGRAPANAEKQFVARADECGGGARLCSQ